jgi:hypothetical protein
MTGEADVNKLIATLLAGAPGAAFKTASFQSKGEKSLVLYVRGLIQAGCGDVVFGSLPYTSADVIINEMPLKVGRADFVIFHADGTASVIEVKDGSFGLMPVLQGVGQAGLYATQLSMTNSVKGVRRALMWSALHKEAENQLVHDVCREADVVPLFLPTVADMHAQDVLCATKVLNEMLAELISEVRKHGTSQ